MVAQVLAKIVELMCNKKRGGRLAPSPLPLSVSFSPRYVPLVIKVCGGLASDRGGDSFGRGTG